MNPKYQAAVKRYEDAIKRDLRESSVSSAEEKAAAREEYLAVLHEVGTTFLNEPPLPAARPKRVVVGWHGLLLLTLSTVGLVALGLTALAILAFILDQ